MGKPSLVHQVTETLNGIFTPNVSRHELKRRGLASERITGITTMRNYVRICCRFAKWCQANYGIDHIRQITPEMAGRFVAEMRDRELSGGHISKVKAALRKFDVAMKRIGYRSQDVLPLLEAGGGWHSDRRPERAYTPREADRIIGDMRLHARDKQTADVAQLQRVAGLRVTEAVMIQGQDIDPRACTVHVVKGTKGGKPRVVTVDPKHRPFLETLKARAEGKRDGHVFQGRGARGASLRKRTADAVRRACKRLGTEHHSTHGFRKTWAQERYRELRDKGLDDRGARRAVAKELGHNRLDVTRSYIPE